MKYLRPGIHMDIPRNFYIYEIIVSNDGIVQDLCQGTLQITPPLQRGNVFEGTVVE